MHDPPVGIHNLDAHTGVMVNEDAELMFWPVVKNAHTSMERWLKTVGFHAMFDVDKADAVPYECFGLVREPVDRYISSVRQMWVEGKAADTEWEAFIEGVDRWNIRNDRCWIADGNLHFASQHSRLGMMPNRALFSTHDLDLMRAWLVVRGLESEHDFPHLNSNTDGRRAVASEILTHEIILTHYQPDCDLWASRRH